MVVTSELHEWKVMVVRAEDGLLMGEIIPENLSFGLRLNDVGFINFDLNLAHGMATKEFIEPYATDFVLMHGPDHIMGGIITGVDIDLRERSLSVGGLDYLHYLDKRMWYSLTPGADATQPLEPNPFIKVQEDISTVLNSMLGFTLALPHSLDLDVSVPPTGILVNFRIEPGDTETILEKIRDLSEQDPGFDFEIMVDFVDGIVAKEFMIYSPTKGEVREYSFEQDRNIKDLSYTDTGITSTFVLGMGAGSSNKLAASTELKDLQPKYRRLDTSVDFGDILDLNMIQRQTNAEAEKVKKTTKENLSGVIIPEPNVTVWDQISIGDACRVIGRTSYESVDDYFRIIGLEVNPTSQGDEEITVVFENASV